MIVLAPHVDDELIGCWRQIVNQEVTAVIYFFDLFEDRIAEAQAFSDKYSIPIYFSDGDPEKFIRGRFDSETPVLAPNIGDNHVHHKMVNNIAKRYFSNIQYYSIDMNVEFDVLEPDQQKQKREALLELYPSQASLFEDEKYWLFESCVPSDMIYAYSSRIMTHSGDMVTFSVKCPVGTKHDFTGLQQVTNLDQAAAFFLNSYPFSGFSVTYNKEQLTYNY